MWSSVLRPHPGHVVSHVPSHDGPAGAAGVAAAAEVPELDMLLGWADEVRGDRVGVRGNADRADDADRHDLLRVRMPTPIR